MLFLTRQVISRRELMLKKILPAAVVSASIAATASAATVVPVIAYGHNNKDNFGGNITDIYNGSGMNGYNWTSGSPNAGNPPAVWPESDVSLWEITSDQYRDEWQADQLLDRTTSINQKVGWVIMDLGDDYKINDMYLWNGIQLGTAALKDFNIYVSTDAASPVIPATQGPTGGTAADDYNFGAAAWTQVLGTQTLADGGGKGATDGVYNGTGDGAADGVYDLGGVTARYVALEMLSRHNNNFDPNSGRIGFAEAGFDVDVVPEPGSLALLGIGGLMMIKRRR